MSALAPMVVLETVRRSVLMGPIRVALVTVVSALTWGCGSKAGPELPVGTVVTSCRGLTSGSGQRISTNVRWHVPTDAGEQRRLQQWCGTVGPGVLQAPRQSVAEPSNDIVIVSWNVHVGGGALAAVVREIRAGGLSGGFPPAGFVLLLQEALRGGPAVPATFPADAPVPGRIEAISPAGGREDVAEVATREGLALLYLPSMRNGRESQEHSEDRGNAILSTFDLADPTAVELPLGRHRRVAVAATISGHDTDNQPWQLRVVSAHLDASTGPRQLWLLTNAQRERQARHLVDVLDNDAIATIVGADLNTWAGGTHEPAFRELQRGFDQVTVGTRFARLLTLDYLFFRLPPGWHTESRPAESAFGSDHRPVLSVVRLPVGAGVPTPGRRSLSGTRGALGR